MKRSLILLFASLIVQSTIIMPAISESVLFPQIDKNLTKTNGISLHGTGPASMPYINSNEDIEYSNTYEIVNSNTEMKPDRPYQPSVIERMYDGKLKQFWL